MIWMAVTADEYELPLSIGKSSWDLARKMQVEGPTIYHLMRLKGKSRYKFNNYHYRIVRIEDEADESN